MLNVSKRTVFRRLQEFSLSTNYYDRDVSNDDLDREIRIAARKFPFYGIRGMRGYLISKGIRVSWQRSRESMWRVDLDGILLRSLKIHRNYRRVYLVPAHFSLWQLDGKNKLICWQLVIHGCIDGFSRKNHVSLFQYQ